MCALREIYDKEALFLHQGYTQLNSSCLKKKKKKKKKKKYKKKKKKKTHSFKHIPLTQAHRSKREREREKVMTVLSGYKDYFRKTTLFYCLFHLFQQ